MKRITMRDFNWMGKPSVWHKDYMQLSLTVDGHMSLPHGPLLLAVSDEQFLFEATISVPSPGCFSGLCIYHLDSTYAALGRSRSQLETHTCIASHTSHTVVDLPTEAEELIYSLKRTGNRLYIGCRQTKEEHTTWTAEVSLPGIELSVSFGPYFTNSGDQPYEGWMHTVRYAKQG
ncbi:hypothetical protein [Sphaerochaeta sp.]|uniref:hypothetical protein n=1 Tax=Sphaerochaeta sp. TaxID=1972642 RepID=UPI002FC5F927